MKKQTGLTESEHGGSSIPPEQISGGEKAGLPPSHAFVVQFREETALEQDYFIGRVEHVVSGETAMFNTLSDLLEFFRRILAAVAAS